MFAMLRLILLVLTLFACSPFDPPPSTPIVPLSTSTPSTYGRTEYVPSLNYWTPGPKAEPTTSPKTRGLEAWSRGAIDEFRTTVGEWAEPECYFETDLPNPKLAAALFCDAVYGWEFTTSLFMAVLTDDSMLYVQRTHFSLGDNINSAIECVGGTEYEEACTEETLSDVELIDYHLEVSDMWHKANGKPGVQE